MPTHPSVGTEAAIGQRAPGRTRGHARPLRGPTDSRPRCRRINAAQLTIATVGTRVRYRTPRRASLMSIAAVSLRAALGLPGPTFSQLANHDISLIPQLWVVYNPRLYSDCGGPTSIPHAVIIYCRLCHDSPPCIFAWHTEFQASPKKYSIRGMMNIMDDNACSLVCTIQRFSQSQRALRRRVQTTA